MTDFGSERLKKIGEISTGSRSREGEGDQNLWMIMAIIQPFKLDAVTLALESLAGFGGMTVSDCRGFGHGKIRDEEHDVNTGGRMAMSSDENRTAQGPRTALQQSRDGASSVTDFTRKIRLEVAVYGHGNAEAVVHAIARAAHTGRRGDGKVLAWPLAHAVRVRTFDVDAGAL